MSPDPTPDAYVIAHVREAMATDPRVAELGIEMTIAAGTLVLTGRVDSVQLRDAAAEVASAHAPDLEVRNDLDVIDDGAAPSPPEHLP